MATVRFSRELIDHIEKAAIAKMEPAVSRARARLPDNAWGQKIYDILFADVIPTVSTLPVGWVKKVNKIKIDRVATRVCSMEFTFVVEQPWPHQFVETEYAKKDSSWSDAITLKDHLMWGEFHAEVAAYHQRVQEAAERRNEFVDMVKKVCGAYSTLAPALKAWPPLWELIPEDVKDRHREVKVREKKEVELDVDLGKLTAMSTAAKFGL